MVAQMAARSPHDRKVVGSNPAQSYETRFLVKDVLLLSHIVIKKERDNDSGHDTRPRATKQGCAKSLSCSVGSTPGRNPGGRQEKKNFEVKTVRLVL